jgi:hypothetical protein
MVSSDSLAQDRLEGSPFLNTRLLMKIELLLLYGAIVSSEISDVDVQNIECFVNSAPFFVRMPEMVFSLIDSDHDHCRHYMYML